MVGARKKAGRGFSQEDWIKHHQDIVTRVNKKASVQNMNMHKPVYMESREITQLTKQR